MFLPFFLDINPTPRYWIPLSASSSLFSSRLSTVFFCFFSKNIAIFSNLFFQQFNNSNSILRFDSDNNCVKIVASLYSMNCQDKRWRAFIGYWIEETNFRNWIIPFEIVQSSNGKRLTFFSALLRISKLQVSRINLKRKFYD